MSAIPWHDAECGRYTADLPLWEELAAAADGPVLDVGAGTGRVALHLARAGFDVTALDIDGELLAELSRRAALEGLEVPTVVADATAFDASGFALVAVPMQTVQLLGDRAAFFACARRAVVAGGLVALAVATMLETFDGGSHLPDPDVLLRDGTRYVSQPTAVRPVPGATRIERVRQTIAADGTSSRAEDAIELASVTVRELETEGAAAGLRPEPARAIAPTDDHVGSEVVLLRG
jgi:SAM-dependent methyltransferase